MQLMAGDGTVCLVDSNSWETVRGKNWSAFRPNGAGPYFRNKRKTVLHRVLVDARDGHVVDHKNGDTLDNTIENLRLGTQGENCANQKKTRGFSKFKGVSMDKRGRNLPWRAKIETNGIQKFLGSFKTEEEAAVAYDMAAIQAWGDFARTNKMLGLLP